VFAEPLLSNCAKIFRHVTLCTYGVPGEKVNMLGGHTTDAYREQKRALKAKLFMKQINGKFNNANKTTYNILLQQFVSPPEFEN
jgi:hypothetical protein